MEYDTEIVVVGGGFAGLTAARELTRRGIEVVILEKVVAVESHDWTADPFSGETWPLSAPNQLEAVTEAARDTSRHMRLAGSNYATGWAGFIDGAIESGARAAQRIIIEFESEK